MSATRAWPPVLAAAALAFTAGFARLAEGGLSFLDSWCYARVAAEMAASGDWIVPTWRGEPFLEKPPLVFWLSAALFRLLGVSEPAALAVVGASSAACVLLAYWLGARSAGPQAGLLASLLLVATPMFLKWGRTYTTDPLFAALSLAALACAWRAGSRAAMWPAAGALAALAVLTRGAAALPVLAALAYLAFRRPESSSGGGRPWPWLLAALAAFVALALPWHFLAAARAGPAFVHTYLGAHTLERARQNLIDSPRAADPFYYLRHLARTGWPALPFLAWGLARLRRAWRPPGEPAGRLDRALLVYLAAQALMLGVVASRSPRYLLPAYPALAVLAARGLVHGLGETGVERLRRWGLAVAALGALAVAVWPACLGSARGEPFRRLARAVEREGASALPLEVDPALVDPWFERAFWFYLGRSPGTDSAPPSSAGAGAAAAPANAGPRVLRVESMGQADACRPPGCLVLERAGPYVLSVRSL